MINKFWQEKDLENFRINLCNFLASERIEIYDELKNKQNAYHAYSSRLQLFVIMMRCLKYDNYGVSFDEERLADEIQLWKYYSNGSIDQSENFYIGIIPLVITNKTGNYIDVIIKKYIDFFKLGIEAIANLYFIVYIIKEAMCSKNKETIFENAKNHLINFSYLNIFGETDKNNLIKFEKERIKILMKYNNISEYDSEFSIKLINSLIILRDDNSVKDLNIEFRNLICRFIDYILSISEGKKEENKYEPRKDKLYNCKEGQIVNHGILGETEIIQNIDKEDCKILLINTKFGCYRLINRR